MDPRAQAQERVGTTLCNKWTLEKLLGVGGMAAVYVASHKIGRREAIKILHREVAQTPDLRARFEQEAQVVNRFRHPGAVEVRDMDISEDGAPFLVMELLSGESLSERAQRLGGIELSELLRLADELLDVLVAAHAVGIIHRDIKLDNLFVQSDGRLKILDFGIARVRDGLPMQIRTRLGATLGTASYMPPEQIKGIEIDARADLFAVGATLFRILAKRRIHEAPNDTQLLLKMASEQAPPLLAVAPNTPREVAQVIDRALRFDRAERYPSALMMQSDVRALREGRPPPYAVLYPLETHAQESAGAAVAPGPALLSAQIDEVTAIGAPPGSLSPSPLSHPGVDATKTAAQAAVPFSVAAPAGADAANSASRGVFSSDAPTRIGPVVAKAPPREAMSSDAVTWIDPVAAKALLEGPVSSDAPTPPGGNLGARAEVQAPLGESISDVGARDSPTIQRYGGKPFMVGAEPTLRSQVALSGPAPLATPVVVKVMEPPAVVQQQRSLGMGQMGTMIMSKSVSATRSAPPSIEPRPNDPSASGRPPVDRAAKAEPKTQKTDGRRLWQLLLLGGVFMLLGVCGTLWALRDEWGESDPAGASSQSAPKTAAPLGSLGGAPLRPTPVAAPSASTNRSGKSR